MLTAVGIASGNTAVLLPITIGFLLVSAALFCGIKKKRPDSGGYTGEQVFVNLVYNLYSYVTERKSAG